MDKETLQDFAKGQAVRAWHYMGAHGDQEKGAEGYTFRVWAPAARAVAVVGDFNEWDTAAHPLTAGTDGVWSGFVPGLARYDAYKYAVTCPDGEIRLKADPYAFHAETRPGTASKIYDLWGYEWGDDSWLKHRRESPIYQRPMNTYEVHLGSWRRTGEGAFLSYRDMAAYLVPYVKEMGFTHVEFMPVTEHPLDDSWGYQCTGYFAATSRFGTPHDFKYLVDQLHQAGVGVILDWVPAHFPKDAFGLYEFDGTPTYEYSDMRKGEHADWGTRVFDYGRPEVRSFLFSSAMFWLEEYHIDGLRVDAVASMLYLDYSRQDGQWTPNLHGGKENLEAIEFIKLLNTHIFRAYPDVMMIAEESTSWPLVSHPVSEGGLGFNLKWNMGWMNDILHYMTLDPYFRQFNHKDITFSFVYAFSENFVLPLSHDEVVHMKGSFLNKFPGDSQSQFTSVRAFYTYMLAHPGKKLMMMGSEFGQWNEWHFEQSLDWHLLEQNEENRLLQGFFQTANAFYLQQSPLWDLDFSWEGFQWLCDDDNQNNCAAFLRKDTKGDFLLVMCNFSPVEREHYRLGVPTAGQYQLVFSTDDAAFGGQGRGDQGTLKTERVSTHGHDQSLVLNVPPMSTVIYRCTRRAPTRKKTATAIAVREKAKSPAVRKPTQKPALRQTPPKPAVKKTPGKPALRQEPGKLAVQPPAKPKG